MKRETIITGTNIVKTFYSGNVVTPVLKGIDISIATGEFVAIMGRSGAGKSTLMYQLSLLDQPTSGEITIDGIDVSTMSENQRTNFRLENMGYVFQSYALLPELSAAENVMVPLIMLGKSITTARQMATNALTLVGLGDRLDNRPSQLSGGEQQRVSIARATAHQPKILFADEPTANLDSASSNTVIDLFDQLNQSGQTIVMVTHEKVYTKYCDRIITLADGVIERTSKKSTSKKVRS